MNVPRAFIHQLRSDEASAHATQQFLVPRKLGLERVPVYACQSAGRPCKLPASVLACLHAR